MDLIPTFDYSKFDSEEYLKSHYSNLAMDPVYGDIWIKKMHWFHEAFATNRIKGQQLLDIGSGPSVLNVISASAHVDRIYLSDFTPQNRGILRNWLAGSLKHDFKSYFKYVVDSEDNGETPCDKEKSLRNKISGILHIDLLQDYPLAPSFFSQFDVLTTSLCKIAAAENKGAYRKMARRIAGMLREGGYLVLFSVEAGPRYKVGEVVFWTLEIKSEEVRDIWKSCGFEIVEWRQDTPLTPGFSECNLYYLMVAKKVSTL